MEFDLGSRFFVSKLFRVHNDDFFPLNLTHYEFTTFSLFTGCGMGMTSMLFRGWERRI